jgi:hypothetical protein
VPFSGFSVLVIRRCDQSADPLDINAAADDTIRSLIEELETLAKQITA